MSGWQRSSKARYLPCTFPQHQFWQPFVSFSWEHGHFGWKLLEFWRVTHFQSSRSPIYQVISFLMWMLELPVNSLWPSEMATDSYSQPKRLYLACRESKSIAAVNVLFEWVKSPVIRTFQAVDNRFQGVASGATWPKSDWRVKQTKAIPVKGERICCYRAIRISDIFHGHHCMSF